MLRPARRRPLSRLLAPIVIALRSLDVIKGPALAWQADFWYFSTLVLFRWQIFYCVARGTPVSLYLIVITPAEFVWHGGVADFVVAGPSSYCAYACDWRTYPQPTGLLQYLYCLASRNVAGVCRLPATAAASRASWTWARCKYEFVSPCHHPGPWSILGVWPDSYLSYNRYSQHHGYTYLYVYGVCGGGSVF